MFLLTGFNLGEARFQPVSSLASTMSPKVLVPSKSHNKMLSSTQTLVANLRKVPTSTSNPTPNLSQLQDWYTATLPPAHNN
ncbi:hypothetical protein SADUNF_Sadunf16G0058600 [Salix dunnii]|uniref:Uncharacterized protein n=1 Tax=Salix dunnii TaxID=1413687 RepID=A0A835J778_9ROSI|nr:hypothetical protein SADUNF_Sadunf16G0058600 [Salix dunnii]